MTHNYLHVCPVHNFSNITACVQKGEVNCKFYRNKCKSGYQYEMSQVGILLRNNEEGDTFVIDKTGFANFLKLSVSKTA